MMVNTKEIQETQEVQSIQAAQACTKTLTEQGSQEYTRTLADQSSQDAEDMQTMGNSPFHVGLRNIKTALAATICALIYLFYDRNPTFACIGAVFGMGGDMSESKLGGGNRLFGTIIGGILGMGLFRIYIIFYPEGGRSPFMLLLLFIGVVLLIVISQFVHWPGAIQPGSVMLCIILFNTPVATYIDYSVNRIVDTGFGVIVALTVNYFLPRHKLVRWLAPLRKNKGNM